MHILLKISFQSFVFYDHNTYKLYALYNMKPNYCIKIVKCFRLKNFILNLKHKTFKKFSS